MRKRKSNWNANQKARWNIINSIEWFEELIQWYEYVRDLRQIYDQRMTKIEAVEKFTKRLERWKELADKVLEIKNMRNMIENRLDSITNYFYSRSTNWYAEWLNSRIGNLITMSKWFRNLNFTVYKVIKMLW